MSVTQITGGDGAGEVVVSPRVIEAAANAAVALGRAGLIVEGTPIRKIAATVGVSVEDLQRARDRSRHSPAVLRASAPPMKLTVRGRREASKVVFEGLKAAPQPPALAVVPTPTPPPAPQMPPESVPGPLCVVCGGTESYHHAYCPPDRGAA